MILFLISFIAGVLTVLAPCVLPLLPVIVGGSLATGSNRRAYTICLALGGSVIAFTLLLKASTVFIMVPESFWQWFSGGILILFGIVMIFPRLYDSLPIVNKLNLSSNRALAAGYQQNSLWGDVIMGAALGPVFSSCSPTYFVILATVLPASFATGVIDLLAYAVGLAGFLFIIAVTGQKLVDRLGVAINPEGWFRRGIGILFLIVGIAVATGAEATTEAWLLNNGFDVTAIEQRLLQSNQSAPAGMCANGICPGPTSTPLLSPNMKASLYPKAPELTGIDGYINTGGAPITIGQFKGKKVVLIDIWTYSCINCQRTLPYVKSWYDKYSQDGLEIIGVHTPEFAFEHVLKNVQDAVMAEGVKYPVVLDNEYATWNAFGNQFWPRKYLIDIDGYIVYDHAGEGDYDGTEAAIQRALAERNQRLGVAASTMPTVAPENVSADATLGQIASPETYFGAARNEFLGNGSQGTVGVQSLTEPVTVSPNTLYLIGQWNFVDEYAETPATVGGSAGSDRVDYRYHAHNVYFVSGTRDATPIDIEVLRDSKPLDPSVAGSDVHFVGGHSYVTISGNRLYSLIKDTSIGDHLLELIISKPGLQAYTFTFG